MWACSRGHTSTALMLYRWNNMAVNIRNIQLQTPLDIARVNNHLDLAKEVINPMCLSEAVNNTWFLFRLKRWKIEENAFQRCIQIWRIA